MLTYSSDHDHSIYSAGCHDELFSLAVDKQTVGESRRMNLVF